MKKVLALAIMAVVAGFGALAGLAGLAGSANATETSTGYIKQYTMSYVSPSENTRPVHKGLAPGEPVLTHCAREGQPLDGSSVWFIIEKDGDAGYVHSGDISVPADTPRC
jgi:hypothetical protein